LRDKTSGKNAALSSAISAIIFIVKKIHQKPLFKKEDFRFEKYELAFDKKNIKVPI